MSTTAAWRPSSVDAPAESRPDPTRGRLARPCALRRGRLGRTLTLEYRMSTSLTVSVSTSDRRSVTAVRPTISTIARRYAAHVDDWPFAPRFDPHGRWYRRLAARRRRRGLAADLAARPGHRPARPRRLGRRASLVAQRRPDRAHRRPDGAGTRLVAGTLAAGGGRRFGPHHVHQVVNLGDRPGGQPARLRPAADHDDPLPPRRRPRWSSPRSTGPVRSGDRRRPVHSGARRPGRAASTRYWPPPGPGCDRLDPAAGDRPPSAAGAVLVDIRPAAQRERPARSRARS